MGGIVDTAAAHPFICDPSENPVTWVCSEDQFPLIMHADAAPRGLLVVGSEGAGKTTAQALWHYCRWLEHLGERREGGQTAPTLARLGLVQAEINKLWPVAWRRYVNRDEFQGYELCDGTRIRFRHTHQQSGAAGSPIQGFNWSWCGRDEMQDQVEVHNDIESRGRAAKQGGTYYKQFCTATAKDEPDWRTLRDKLETAKGPRGPLWQRTTLYGRRSPFVSQEFWDAKRESMPRREYQRRVECIDVGPEKATYPDWSRERNLITVPEIGWVDVTEHELRGSAANRPLLVGHDPGALWHVSLLGKAYVRSQDHQSYLRGVAKPFWVIRGEVNDEQVPVQRHIDHLLSVVRSRFQLNQLTSDGKPNPNGRQMLVRADPADLVDKEDARTHKTVYTQFANAGIHIKPAAYNADHDGHGKVPKDPGIEVVNTLIGYEGENGQPGLKPRLFIERLPDGSPAAPMLVRSIEQAERDERGKAEAQRKGAGDISHWTAALRYMLWAIERPRLKQMRNA